MCTEPVLRDCVSMYLCAIHLSYVCVCRGGGHVKYLSVHAVGAANVCIMHINQAIYLSIYTYVISLEFYLV